MCAIHSLKQLVTYMGETFYRDVLPFPSVLSLVLRSYDRCVQ